MNFPFCQAVRALVFLLLWPVLTTQAAHPLITEDAGTQGAGHFQFELTGEYARVRERGQRQVVALNSAVLAYGFIERADVILTVPTLRLGAPDSSSGLADVGLDIKWRFLESGSLSLAYKPGLTFPTGNDARHLGSGELRWSSYLVGSLDANPWAFHLHLGHLHNNNTFNDRTKLWHASVAVVRQWGDQLKVVLDAGLSTNTDRRSDTPILFVTAGGIWSPRSNLDFDFGLRTERTDTLRALTTLVGATTRW